MFNVWTEKINSNTCPINYWEISQISEVSEAIQTNKKLTTMKTLKGLMSQLLDKETQTLYKTDFINGDLELTQKGKDRLLELLFLTNKKELVSQAEQELKEAENKINNK